jgi:hypothetical protein
VCSQRVDATPSGINLRFKGGVTEIATSGLGGCVGYFLMASADRWCVLLEYSSASFRLLVRSLVIFFAMMQSCRTVSVCG